MNKQLTTINYQPTARNAIIVAEALAMSRSGWPSRAHQISASVKVSVLPALSTVPMPRNAVPTPGWRYAIFNSTVTT